MTDFAVSMWLKSPTHYLCHPYTHRHTHMHLPAFSHPFVVGEQRLFEMFYMCRTRLLSLPLSYFTDTHTHTESTTHTKTKIKARGIITWVVLVWWHPYAISRHPKILSMSVSPDLYIYIQLLFIYLYKKISWKVKTKLSYMAHLQTETAKRRGLCQVPAIESSPKSFVGCLTISCLTRNLCLRCSSAIISTPVNIAKLLLFSTLHPQLGKYIPEKVFIVEFSI